MAAPMLHDIVLFVLAFGDKEERERSINACNLYGRVATMKERVKDNHLQSRSFSAMALRDRGIPTAIVVKPTLF